MKHYMKGIVMTRWAAIALLLLQVGCASIKKPDFLGARPTAKSHNQSQIELQIAFAKAAEGRGETKHALSVYEELAKSNQATAEVHHRAALIYDHKGDSAQAERHYLASLKLAPGQATVLCDYGYSLYLDESLELSEVQYRDAIKSDPQYMRARANLGMLLARTDRMDEALHQFALAGLSEGESHHNIALAATENGNSHIAVTALERARKADWGRKPSGDRQGLQQVVHRIAARKSNSPLDTPVVLAGGSDQSVNTTSVARAAEITFPDEIEIGLIE
jgi:Tfp pilus assembly protein PilF